MAAVSDLTRTDGWAPIRRALGIRSFGVNAWTAERTGDELIPEHVEITHEELYLVMQGHARFTVDGHELDAPSGTLLLVSDPARWRSAVAAAPHTVVLSVGGPPGAVFQPNAWEVNRDVLPLFEQGRFGEAKRMLQAALDEYADASYLLYNLACAEAQLGDADAAFDNLRRAVAGRPELKQMAPEDADLAGLRDDPRFDELTR